MDQSTATPAINRLKSKLAAGEPVVGVWSIVSSPTIVELLALGGMDFVILDMEHGVYGVDALESCTRAVEQGGAVPLVRTPGIDPSASQWALDIGAHGIVVPQVGTADDARRVVESAKYAPDGFRGYNPFTRAALYANPSDNRSGKLSNEFSLTCVIIESEDGLANLDAICATPGLDVVYMGIYDLAVALGAGGNTSDPRVVEVVEASIARIRASGKSAGMMVRSQKDVRRALDLGATFLVYSVDTALIREAVVGAVQSFTRELPPAGSRSGEEES